MGGQALIIEHDHASPPGYVGARLRERGFELEEFLVVPAEHYHRPSVRARFPDPTSFDLVVVLGAVWSVYDTATIGTWVADELAMLQRAEREGVPVLGVCFGGQALAQALGGRVERAARPEIGWTTVESADHGLIPPGPWFQFHYDRWTLPARALEVARNDLCSQAFVIGRSLAVQFHPELDPPMLRLWLEHGGDAEVRAAGLDPEALLEQSLGEAGAASARAARLVDAFVDRVATRNGDEPAMVSALAG